MEFNKFTLLTVFIMILTQKKNTSLLYSMWLLGKPYYTVNYTERIVLIMIRRLYEDEEIYDAQTEWLNNVPLDELFVEIRKRTGIRELRFTSEMKSTWRHENYISIKSNDIADKTGFLRLMFKTLFIKSELSVSQGNIDEGEPEFSLWGDVGFRYSHPDMGSNGYSFLRCWYNDIDGWTFREVS